VLRVILAGLQRGQHNSLIAPQFHEFIHRAKVEATKEQLGFTTNDEKFLRSCLSSLTSITYICLEKVVLQGVTILK